METQTKNKEFLRAVKFVLISASAGIIQILADIVFNEFIGLKAWLSYLLSLIMSVVWNFTINRKFTFKSANNIKIAMLLVACFYVVFTPVSTLLTNVLTKSINVYVVQAIMMVSNLVLEYFYTRFVVYRNSCDTAVKKEEPYNKQTIL